MPHLATLPTAATRMVLLPTAAPACVTSDHLYSSAHSLGKSSEMAICKLQAKTCQSPCWHAHTFSTQEMRCHGPRSPCPHRCSTAEPPPRRVCFVVAYNYLTAFLCYCLSIYIARRSLDRVPSRNCAAKGQGPRGAEGKRKEKRRTHLPVFTALMRCIHPIATNLMLCAASFHCLQCCLLPLPPVLSPSTTSSAASFHYLQCCLLPLPPVLPPSTTSSAPPSTTASAASFHYLQCCLLLLPPVPPPFTTSSATSCHYF
jgi:hypothetical protein